VHKFWSILFGAVLLAELLLCLAAPAMGWWLPPLANSTNVGKEVDKLFYFILAATGFFFILTEAVLVYTMWRYAGKPGEKAVYVHGDHHLEIAWTAVPAVLLILISLIQIDAWADIKYQGRMRPPQHIIEVSARQFEWRVRYPEKAVRERLAVPTESDPWDAKPEADRWGSDPLASASDLHVVNEVHTWVGANTRVYLKTRDVLHSFFLPQLRLKQDAVPGKIIPVWFKTDDYNGHWDKGKNEWVYVKEDGRDKVWELACAELCGWGHYKMQGRFYVHKNKDSYDAWLEHTLKKHRSREREQTPAPK
jgi:cytochrome c oxidase subunit 2